MSDDTENTSEGTEAPTKLVKRREIPGNLPYSASPGVFESILKAIQTAERPPVFSSDFMKSVLGFSGGSARAAPPLMKKLGLLDSGGHPTSLYADFQADYSRPAAALTALKNGFPEIFKRNTYAHKASESEIKDIIVQITGLKKNDQLVRLILKSYESVRNYAQDADEIKINTDNTSQIDSPLTNNNPDPSIKNQIGLSYQINIVLPPTDNVEVFNAIFKSLKENLLK